MRELLKARRTLGVATMLALGLVASACAPKGGSSAGTVAAGWKSIDVTLTEFAITPASLSARPGQDVTLMIHNGGTAPHQVAVQLGARNVQTPMLNAGAMANLHLGKLSAGTYEVWCTVPGHKELGMKATLAVGAGASGTETGMAMGSSSGPSMGGMTAQQMADGHKRSVVAFPAKTQGLGGQVLQPTMDGDVQVYHLKAEEVRWEVSPGVFKQVYAYNGTVPGPEIRVHQGDTIRVVLENALPEPTVIHWHGLTVPNAMDGVPYITQDPVMPGGYFDYQFTIKDSPGLYLYHSHFDSANQVAYGLYGPIVVEPKGTPDWQDEYTLILNDGPLGYTINGKSFPATAPLTAKLGDWVRIHVANVGEMLHPLHMHGYHFLVVEQDGQPVPAPYLKDTVVVAPGETYDLMVHAIYPGVWALHCHILSHVEGPQGMFGMVTALIVK